MKKFLLLSFMLMLSFAFSESWAQDRTVTGQVTSVEDGSTLPGVNVVIKGTTIGTVTDIDGNYSLQVSGNNVVLVFSFIGLATEEAEVGSRSVVNIAMTTDIKQLSEVVVIGYGTQTRRKITGAIGSTGTEAFENIPVADPLQALQGRVAGVEVSSSSGRPGGANIVRIRGVASIGGANANNPLYVVDGVPISNRDDSQQAAGQGFSPIANLNPDDIASMEVLKDAAAAAIYGSRASNGVVLITTKKGSYNEKTQFDIKFSQGVQELTNTVDFLNARQFREIMRESRANAGLAPDAQFDDDPSLQTTDWIDLIQRDDPRILNFSLSAQGGSEKTKFFVSANYFQQESILKKGEFERFSTRFNLEHYATDKVNIGFNIQAVRSFLFQTAVDNSIFSPWPTAVGARPDEVPFDGDGAFTTLATVNNPIRNFENTDETTVYNVLSNAYAEIELIKGLRFKTLFGVDFNVTRDFGKDPITSFQGEGVGGAGFSGDVFRLNWLTENTLNYTTKLADERLTLNALVGYTYQVDTRDRTSVAGNGFPSDDFEFLTSAAQNTAFSSDQTENRLVSYLSRVNLDWDDKYLLSLSVRRDGSSKFGVNNRFGTFSAVSAGWRVSGEEFMKSLSNVIDDLKLRASWGQTGNQAPIGDFTSLDLIGSGANYNDLPGFAPTQLGNPDLTWETADQIDIGLDVTVLNSRLNLTVDYFKKTTKDLLLPRTLPFETGFGTVQQNIGEMENTGFEFGINSLNIDGDVRWTTSLNVTTLDNEVTALVLSPNGEPTPIDNGFVSRTDVGQPIGSYYVVKYLGVDPQTGDALYDDISGPDGVPDGAITADDRQFLGNPIPDVSGGFTNTVTYKGFDLSIFFSFAFGREVYRLDAEGQGGLFDGGLQETGVNMDARMINRWQQPGDITDVPRAIAGAQGVFNTQRSSRFIEDADFIRLKNVTLGYNFPKSIIEKAKLRSLRLYFTGQNLWTETDFTGFDPEISSSLDQRQAGVDQGAIPQLKNYTFGVNIGF